MTSIVYSVTASLPDPETADRYVHWLTHGHTAQVILGGAQRAEVCGPFDSPPPPHPDPTHPRPPQPQIVETRYVFPTREAFATYEREHAPKLRAEGAALFGSCLGVLFSRRVAPLIHTLESPIG